MRSNGPVSRANIALVVAAPDRDPTTIEA